MANRKNDILGAGVAGILGKGPAPAAPEGKKEEEYFAYRKGRPRKDDVRAAAFSEGKKFEATSLWLEKDQYRRIREMAQDRRITIKEMMYVLLEAGLKKVDK